MKKMLAGLLFALVSSVQSVASAGVIQSEYSKITGPMQVVTSVVGPLQSYYFTSTVNRNASNPMQLDVSVNSGQPSFNLYSLYGALVNFSITDANGYVGLVTWNNQQNKGKVSGTFSPSFTTTPFTAFLGDFTASGYDMSIVLKDTSGRTFHVPSINEAFGFSPSYDWSAAGSNELTVNELLNSPSNFCGESGCADYTKINGFSLTMSPFGATASGTVPEPSGLALIGLGSLFLLKRRKQ